MIPGSARLQLAGRVRSINQAHEEQALAWQVSESVR
jgi:hypothetical protein